MSTRHINIYDLKMRKNGIPYLVIKDKISLSSDECMCSPESIARFAVNHLGVNMLAEEYVYVLSFSTRLDIMGVFELSHGNIVSSVVDPRQVITRILISGAHSFCLLHNHPSGNPFPSNDDIKVTDAVENAAKLSNVNFLDHIIVGDGSYYSFMEKDGGVIL